MFSPASSSSSAPPVPVSVQPPPMMMPVALPPTWSLLRAAQFLYDQQQKASATGQRLRRWRHQVSLEGLGLGYLFEVVGKDEPMLRAAAPSLRRAADMDVDIAASSDAAQEGSRPAWAGKEEEEKNKEGWVGLSAIRRPAPTLADDVVLPPARKRQRTMEDRAVRQHGGVAADEEEEGSGCDECQGGLEHRRSSGPGSRITMCGASPSVLDALELLALLRSSCQGLAGDTELWVSTKLDKKLQEQLEDALGV